LRPNSGAKEAKKPPRAGGVKASPVKKGPISNKGKLQFKLIVGFQMK